MVPLTNYQIDIFPFFELTPDLVIIAGSDGYFKKVNSVVVDKFEYTEEELFTSPISSLIHPDDLELTRKKREELLKGQTLVNFQNRYISKTGKIISLDWTSIYFSDKNIVLAVAKDVTERMQREKEIIEKYEKFKDLAFHFKDNIEKDRKSFAMELHEEIAQLVSVIKMDVDWLSNNLNDLSDSAKRKIENASIVSKMLMNMIRKLSFSISPSILDDLGLDVTLKWLCNEFSNLNNIPCRYENRCEEIKLTHEIKLDFFRICQESLSNILKHSNANNVLISIEEVAGQICLNIEDDGIGFDENSIHIKAGLSRMQSLAISINGQLSIDSEIGKGTKVSLMISKHLIDENIF